jgi:hypothetical protein
LRSEQLDDIMLDFELKIIAYHAGWPQSEELIGLCGKQEFVHEPVRDHRVVSAAPYRGYHAIGTALQWCRWTRRAGFDLPFDDLNEFSTTSAISICQRVAGKVGISGSRKTTRRRFSAQPRQVDESSPPSASSRPMSSARGEGHERMSGKVALVTGPDKA